MDGRDRTQPVEVEEEHGRRFRGADSGRICEQEVGGGAPGQSFNQVWIHFLRL